MCLCEGIYRPQRENVTCTNATWMNLNVVMFREGSQMWNTNAARSDSHKILETSELGQEKALCVDGAGAGVWIANTGHGRLWGLREGFRILVVVVTKLMGLYT